MGSTYCHGQLLNRIGRFGTFFPSNISISTSLSDANSKSRLLEADSFCPNFYNSTSNFALAPTGKA
jgi:hypothetical protein